MELCFYNSKNGYLEAFLRGLRSSFLTPDEYKKLTEVDTLDDFKSVLEDTDYGSFMMDEPSPIAVTTIAQKCKEKMAHEFNYIRAQAEEPLRTFLDYIAKEKMIDNVISLIQGTLNKKNPEELLSRVDPLGYFPQMKAITSMDVQNSHDDVLKILLIETPIGTYFDKYISTNSSNEKNNMSTILNDMDIEILRNTLKKAWLEDFYDFIKKLGGKTEEVMGHILKSVADFRVLSVTLNTINSSLSLELQKDRNDMFPCFGYLYPEGTDKIRKCWNNETVQAALENYPTYYNLYEECKQFYIKNDNVTENKFVDHKIKSLEDLLYVKLVKLCETAFDQHCHFGIFYAWVKLKEQEIRNIIWISDMILMNRKDCIDSIIPIFEPQI
ncbi:hypothetical protein YYC_00657 [Plasmodium yoelii 17X]|uniref:V-type proton ATPase subunit n=4 Tax=Plasmodium yoelii TaxID=5861 RepID=A0AAF0B815_PLAYO|nr:ATP synthase (C/AC39) subunit, putative [Plasmodium yoelii]EAA16260.1 ATP synthase subunit [Plasmodium yoelii yoelii]ETB63066.1 hypothetical protein YYC_00657 [Plasmodium yoelii 17X]WBY60015.1 ATP synthase (C/AC39) subunit [Plasmodium yoelii yoelii]CDU19948.1 ATP synthase (C/AC39) subunit, putative [Plasmodium yoelii]VTZ80706.1 ATP synthase (C/AC39) subunit, putative [Plasmodium yoelii]|eukprot:XP_724695.1 ATP synthase (C/AC39) subunit, putative [Plasmodium yoelii]